MASPWRPLARRLRVASGLFGLRFANPLAHFVRQFASSLRSKAGFALTPPGTWIVLQRRGTKLHNLLDLTPAQSQHVIVLIRAEEPIDPRAKFTKANRGQERTGRGFGNTDPDKQPTYVAEVEVNCEECGGSGYDPGSLDPWGPEVCSVCHGAKTQTITPNYLAEAFQIASNPDRLRPIERLHLVAIIQHCREAC